MRIQQQQLQQYLLAAPVGQLGERIKEKVAERRAVLIRLPHICFQKRRHSKTFSILALLSLVTL
jgi:hypothetical protein